MPSRWERTVNFAEDAHHDIGVKVGQIRSFFREVRRVYDEPDWRKRARENERHNR